MVVMGNVALFACIRLTSAKIDKNRANNIPVPVLAVNIVVNTDEKPVSTKKSHSV